MYIFPKNLDLNTQHRLVVLGWKQREEMLINNIV